MKSGSLLVLIWLVVGCGSSAVKRNEPVQLQPSEGLLVFGVETDSPVRVVDFCRFQTMSPCFSIESLNTAKDLAVHKSDAGRYCITRMWMQSYGRATASVYTAEEPSVCVDIVPGKITYPGHLKVHRREGQMGSDGIAFTWTLRRDEVRATLGRDYPDLSRIAVVLGQ